MNRYNVTVKVIPLTECLARINFVRRPMDDLDAKLMLMNPNEALEVKISNGDNPEYIRPNIYAAAKRAGMKVKTRLIYDMNGPKIFMVYRHNGRK